VLLASLLDDAEACGLASLISFAASRARAREVDGRFVPLEEQDPAAWDDGLVADGERLLARAPPCSASARASRSAGSSSRPRCRRPTPRGGAPGGSTGTACCG